jgi:pimeloyl-ACP methyl ester carboxylesterase
MPPPSGPYSVGAATSTQVDFLRQLLISRPSRDRFWRGGAEKLTHPDKAKTSAAFSSGWDVERFGRPDPPEEAAYRLRALAGCSILRALLASMVGESAEHLDEIGCPVLLVGPTGDRVLPKAQFAPSLLSALPNAQLLEPSDVGHVPMYDALELIARIILDFARAHPVQPAALTA